MSKRTSSNHLKSNPKNFHPTPIEAAIPLSRVLDPFTQYDEPCAGHGELISHLTLGGHRCVRAMDVIPRAAGIQMMDASLVAPERLVITNPPFTWSLLRPLLDRWVGHVPTWLLLPWDMPCNLNMVPYAAYIDRVLPLGRVSWMRNGQGGMENYGWFHFAVTPSGFFYPRLPKGLSGQKRNTIVTS